MDKIIMIAGTIIFIAMCFVLRVGNERANEYNHAQTKVLLEELNRAGVKNDKG